MGYLGNVASDLRSASTGRRMFKSLRDVPGYKDKGYAFAYNLGTVGALTGVSTSKARGGLYNSLQFSNDVKAAVNPQQATMKSLTRRGVYKLAAFGYSRILNSFMPTGGGLGGRGLRVLGGRFTSLRLRRLDFKIRNQLYTEFKVDSKKIDDYVKGTGNKVALDFLKIQKGMQAIAISNAPDPYAIHRFNRNNADGSLGRLGKEDQIMSAFSLSTFDDDNIDALLSRKDIVDIMGSDALAGSPNSFNNISTHGFGPHQNGRILESLYAPNTGNQGTFERSHTPSMTNSEAKSLADLAVGESGIGAEYAFGNPTGGTETVTKIKEFIAETMLLADKMGPDFTGPVQNHVNMAIATARSLQEKLDVMGPEGVLQIGKSVDVMRYLHGDDANYTGTSSYRKKSRYRNADLNIYGAPVEKTVREDVVRNVQVKEGEYASTSFVMPNLERKEKTGRDRFGGDIFEDVPIQGPNTSKKYFTGGTVTEKRVRTQQKIKKVTGENLGSLKYKKALADRQKPNPTPINRDTHLVQNFSDNPTRHNFVPNRRQIQSAIHSKKPNTSPKGKEATVEYVVSFGGKTPQSTKNDAIRDSYQIEYGGPGTDKRGKLTERTDMFTYTPSLFMYRSALGAAKAFGLEVSSGKNVVGHVSGGLAGTSASNSLSDIFVKSRGVSGPTGKRERQILEELYEKSAKNINNPIFENGNLMLSKNKVLSTAFDTGSLDLASDTLNDAIFGGRRILNQMGVADKTGRRPGAYSNEGRNINDRRAFEKVIRDEDSILNQEKAIHRMQKEMGRTGQVMPSDDFLDEFVVGFEYNEPPPQGFNYREHVDPKTKEITYEITSRQFDQADLPLNDEGKPFIPGQIINARSKKNVTSLDSGFNYEDPGVREDVEILRDMEANNISGPDDPKFEKQVIRAKIGRQLQFQSVSDKINRQFRQRLSILGDELGDSEIVDFANRLTNNLLRDIRKINPKYAGGGPGGVDNLTPREINLIVEFAGAQFEALNTVIHKSKRRSRGVRRTRNQFHTESINNPDVREQIIRDSEASARNTFGVFFDEKARDDILEIFSDTMHLNAVIDGTMDINRAIHLTKRRSELALGRIENRIENPITDTVSDVSGKKRARVDIPGTTLTPSGRSGDGPVGQVVATTSAFDQLIEREEKEFGLRNYSTAAQLKYCQREINRLERANDRAIIKSQIIRKCEASPFIKSAFIRFISQDSNSRGMGLDGSVESIRQYLDTFYSNIGLAPPDF